MRSMTGFGRSIKANDVISCTVEIKTVNSKFTELNIKVPRHLYALEDSIRGLIGEYIYRGKVDLLITTKELADREQQITVNHALSEQIKAMLVEEGFYRSPSEVRLSDILAITKEYVQVEELPLAEDQVNPLVLDTLRDALEQLVSMREREGNNLKGEIESRLVGVEKVFNHIESKKDVALTFYENRLLERMKKSVEKLDADVSMERFMQEVAVLSDKVDITEEIVRFKSHVIQLKDIIQEIGPIGRKLDFLLQEMNREVNTMGSKGNHEDIVNAVVALKVELEKVREQIQNVE